MPYSGEWAEPAEFLRHEGKIIYHVYRDDDLSQGPRTYLYGTSSHASEGGDGHVWVFDVRDLGAGDAESDAGREALVRAAIDRGDPRLPWDPDEPGYDGDEGEDTGEDEGPWHELAGAAVRACLRWHAADSGLEGAMGGSMADAIAGLREALAGLGSPCPPVPTELLPDELGLPAGADLEATLGALARFGARTGPRP